MVWDYEGIQRYHQAVVVKGAEGARCGNGRGKWGRGYGCKGGVEICGKKG